MNPEASKNTKIHADISICVRLFLGDILDIALSNL